MKYAATILQMLDGIFTNLICIPILFILYCKFSPFKKRGKKWKLVYRICLGLVMLYLIRCFFAGFIFTEINYPRFTDSPFLPVYEALFYPNHG
ncbi:hypothetical protein [Clostridium sp. C105KSO13]|uniref:hypothetical protein n=1 Tax=Clostridium sp. C105KSO13 TaxID=1776045 RepID=UPI0007407BB3|nr:hypothetical protein [Clostridium sp. C105KSO13]CUX25569.1 hypothetical protein BN3456_00830 [Clostridium sp. C105KSO13]